jgi:ubiquinol-cytochrome c reductase cytochrome c1 subunit
MHNGLATKLVALAGLLLAGTALAAEGGVEGATAPAEAAEHGDAGHGASGVDWQAWRAGNEVENTASLQRGAANFVSYCLACHSLKYMRWSRLAEDLDLSPQLLESTLLPAGAKSTDYILNNFPAADAATWFGKAPPDLSLAARSRGTDWIYQFLKGFYVDTTKATGTNNLVLDGASMPAVLSGLEGVKGAVFAAHGSAGSHGGPAVERFEYFSPGSMAPEEFDGFVRDTVNFLDYVGDPGQARRRSIGLWAVLFLLAFTGVAWALKKEYWKDVH